MHLIGFSVAIAIFALCCWGVFRMAPWLVRLLGQTGIHYPYHGSVADGAGD
jgi:small neutral amino acid transporter SnatA (MarC family)